MQAACSIGTFVHFCCVVPLTYVMYRYHSSHKHQESSPAADINMLFCTERQPPFLFCSVPFGRQIHNMTMNSLYKTWHVHGAPSCILHMLPVQPLVSLK